MPTFSSAPSLQNTKKDRRAHQDILQYWLALLRYQEALGARPNARQDAAGLPPLPNLKEPVFGRDYAKVPFEGAERLLVERHGQCDVELDPEWFAFFEDWLATRYVNGEDDDSRVALLLSFPTIYLPRGELTGLLRFPAQIDWRSGDKSFEVPSRMQRSKSGLPTPPSHARLTDRKEDVEDSSGALPFFVDARVLRDTLKIHTEKLDEFFAALRAHKNITPKQVSLALCRLIARQNELEDNPGKAPLSKPQYVSKESPKAKELLAQLQQSTADRLKRLRSKARSYAIALAISSDRSRATWHLQRDIQAALELVEEPGLPESSPLKAYLTGNPPPSRVALCLGRWQATELTSSQREAAELALGSTLSAVQGPPGTGKTTLILNLLADTLVRKITALAETQAMGGTITVVTSTNNRAVDNVVDPLGAQLDADRLALSLRLGSRHVTQTTTRAELKRAQQWLERQTGSLGHYVSELAAALKRFKQARADLTRHLAATTLSPSSATLHQQLFDAAVETREAWARRHQPDLLKALKKAVRVAEQRRSLRSLLDTPGGAGLWLRWLFPAWGCTLLSLGNNFPPEAGAINTAVIDEAGQCHPAYAVASLLRADSTLVIGDVHQLEPVVGLSRDDEQRIVRGLRLGPNPTQLAPFRAYDGSETSAQSAADRAVVVRPTLVDHFRCQAPIAAISEALCDYGLVTHTPRRSRVSQAPFLVEPVLHLDLQGRQARYAGSWMNEAELHACVELVQSLLATGILAEEIGVITPYRGQLECLWRLLRNAHIPLERPHGKRRRKRQSRSLWRS